MQLLFGHEYYMTDQLKGPRRPFRHVLAKQPGHASAGQYMYGPRFLWETTVGEGGDGE